MGISVKPGVSFSSYPLHPASPQATPWHHHPLTDSLFHYLVSTRISQKLNLAWTQVTCQPNLSSPAAEPDMSPNPVHDLTRLTEQLNLTLATPCATWSSHPARLVSPYAHAQPRIRQPCPPRTAHPMAWFFPSSSGAKRSQEVLFPKKKSKPTRNRN
jgi:hypothetical protein